MATQVAAYCRSPQGLHTCGMAISMDAATGGSYKLLATQNSGTGAACRSASGPIYLGSADSQFRRSKRLACSLAYCPSN